MLVELAWGWLPLQPDSLLTQWFHRRFAGGGKRMQRVGIVALARRLAIALWRYLEHGEVPTGARSSRQLPEIPGSTQPHATPSPATRHHDPRSTRPECQRVTAPVTIRRDGARP
jgi:hypothetical protein